MSVSFKSAPEYSSIVAFAEFLYAEDRDSFTHQELTALNYRLRIRIDLIRSELESYGIFLEKREVPLKVRGFSTSSNDRWFGPGSMKTHGGAAYGSMMVSKYESLDTIF